MKRIAFLLCLALIGSLLHAAVGSVASVAAVASVTEAAPPVSETPAELPTHQASSDAQAVLSQHHDHAHAGLHATAPAVIPAADVCSRCDVPQDACHAAQDACCLGAAILPALPAVATPATAVAIAVPASRVTAVGEPGSIYKPPRS